MRRVAALIAVGALLTAVAACSSKKDPADPPAAADPVELSFAVYGDEATVSVYRTIAAAYTAAHPEVTFTIASYPDAQAAAEAVVSAGSTAHAAPDVFLADLKQLPTLVQAQSLEPVDEMLEHKDMPFGDGFQRTALEAFSANNRLMCMPNDVSPVVAYFNTSLIRLDELRDGDGAAVDEPLTKAWDLDTFEQVLEQAVARGARGTYIPPTVTGVAPFVVSAGGKLVDDTVKPTHLTLSSDNAIDAIKQIGAITHDHELSLTPEEVASKKPLQWFTEGDLGVYFGTRADLPTLRATPGLQFDAVQVPVVSKVATTADMNAFCVSAKAPARDAIADFIKFATLGAGAKLVAQSGSMVPAALTWERSDDFLQPDRLPDNATVYAEAARRVVELPYSTKWTTASASANTVLQYLLYNPLVDLTGNDSVWKTMLKQVDDGSAAILQPPTTSPSPSPTASAGATATP